MIDTSHSAIVGSAGIWTPNSTLVGSFSKSLTPLIKSLFSDGTQGIYLNAQDALSVSDLSSVKDLSGNNNHALQANSTSHASLITDPSGYKSLKFDGIDDGYVTQSIDFSKTDKVTIIAAVRKLADSDLRSIVETGSNYSSPTGGFALFAPATNNNADYGYGVSGGGIFYNKSSAPIYNAPNSAVLSLSCDLAITTSRGEQSKFKVNSVGQVAPTGGVATGKFANNPIYIGRRAGTSLPFSGQIYALLVIGKLLDDATTARIEKEFAKYIGVTL